MGHLRTRLHCFNILDQLVVGLSIRVRPAKWIFLPEYQNKSGRKIQLSSKRTKKTPFEVVPLVSIPTVLGYDGKALYIYIYIYIYIYTDEVYLPWNPAGNLVLNIQKQALYYVSL